MRLAVGSEDRRLTDVIVHYGSELHFAQTGSFEYLEICSSEIVPPKASIQLFMLGTESFWNRSSNKVLVDIRNWQYGLSDAAYYR
jgi:hypothetical protein